MSNDFNLRELKDNLARGPVEIRFVKLDGSQRIMLATTNSDHFVYKTKGAVSHSTPDSRVITVWDLMKDDWRSIRVSSIISWTVQG